MDAEKITVSDLSPYPEITVQRPNPQFAERLSSTFGGPSGELSAISGYIYQSLVFRKNFPEYARVIDKIALVEMKHLDMIGELILKLEGKPIYAEYSDGIPVYWSGESITYADDLATALVGDLRGEQKAYSAYITLARQSGDKHVFSILTRIALDEMIHAGVIKNMINELRFIG